MRKSLSILLAITLVFSMFGSLAFAAGTELTAQQQFEALKEKGIFVGINEAGDAGLDQDMTRAEFARVAALLLGLDVDAMPAVSKFTDVGLAHWAVEEIHAVEAAGVMTGNGNMTFTPSANVTIEQVARVLIDALGIEIEVDAEVAGASNWAQGYVKAAIGLGLISATADFQSNAKRELLVTSAYTADAAIVAAEEAAAAAEEAAKVLTVASVTAINLKQMVVAFNKAVDKTTAETKTNYTFDGADLAAGDVVQLNEDGKSVTITLATPVANQSSKKLIVETGVKSAALVALAANVTTTVDFTDTTVPYAVKAVQIAPNKIKVYFNEPVKNTGGTAFQVDNGTLSAVVGTISDTDYSVEVTLGAKITTGTHSVVVNPSTSTAVKDYANYVLPTATVSFDAVTDVTAPTATVTASSQTKLIVEFSEVVTGFAASDIYHTTTGYTANSVTAVAGSTTQYEVVFTTNPLPTGTAVVVIAKEAVTDLFDNKFGAATTYSVVVSSDVVAPTVTKVEVKDENKLLVTFSEDVTGTTVASNYVVKTSAGVAITDKAFVNSSGNPVATITYASKVATLTFGTNIDKGDYLLEVKGIKDIPVNPNTLVTTTYAFTIVDKTAPTVNTLTLINSKKLVIDFSEAMSVVGTTSILEAGKYTLAGVALPAGTTLTAGTNNASVVIVLPDSHAGVSVGVAMQVGQVADAAGNVTANLATSLTAISATAATIVAGSVKATSVNTVTFEINKPLSNIQIDDFTVNAVAAASGVYENKTLADGTTYGAVVTLTVGTAGEWATNATPAVTVVATIDTKDTLGTAIAANAGIAAIDKMAPAVAKVTVNGIEYADIQAKDLDGNSKLDTVEITYTENIFAGSVGIQSYEVEGYTIVNATVATNKVTLTLTEKATIDTSATPNVKQVLSIQDGLGAGLRNDKAAEVNFTVARDFILPTLDTVVLANGSGTAATLDVNDIITLTFSEAMNTTGNATFSMTNGVITLQDTTVLTFGTANVNAGTGTIAWNEAKTVATLTFTVVTVATTIPAGAVTPSAIVVKDASFNLLKNSASAAATGNF